MELGTPAWRRVRSYVDWPLVCLTVLICAIGLANLYSATRYAQKGLFQQQIVWMLIGLGSFALISVIDYRVWQRAAMAAVIIGIVAVVGVHIIGIAVKGSRRWLGWGSFRVQPSEFMKLALILWVAKIVQEKDDVHWLSMLARIFCCLGAIGLVAWQPDLGTAILAALICLSVAYLAMPRLSWMLLFLVAKLGVLPLVWVYVLHPYQKQRILTWSDPSSDPSGAGWHIRQSILAVGSGRMAGKGYMGSTQNQFHFLPEHWTDFPFAVWAEEWGFAGAIVLLGLYLFLVLWIINVASQARDRFGATICVGVAALIFWHVLVNIAMVTGLAPVVGVTLPLVSYGGSSVLTIFFGLGLVASVSVRRYAH